METIKRNWVFYVIGVTIALIISGGVGFYFGTKAPKKEIAVVTPTPMETALPTPNVTAQLDITPLPTGTVWKYFTSKNWSFAYPSDAKIETTGRYVEGDCYDSKKIYVGCGSLTVEYKELRLEHAPCTECSPGNNNFYMIGKAVLVFGNYEDGIIRTLVEKPVTTAEKAQVTIAYSSFHRGSLFPVSVVMDVPIADVGDYYAVSDRIAISVFTTGREVTNLPTPEFYPLAFSTDNNIEVIDKEGTLVESLNDYMFGILNGTGTYLALAHNRYYDLTSKKMIEIEDGANLFDSDYKDLEMSEWISDHEFLSRQSCDEGKVCAPGVIVNLSTKSLRAVQQTEIDTLSKKNVYKYTP